MQNAAAPQWLPEVQQLLADALTQVDRKASEFQTLSEAAVRLERPTPRVILSGQRSVGKSSVVCALWGQADLLPTAERDCTQTNTLIRAPASGESDLAVRLNYLSREQATEFETHSFAFHHLREMLGETLGPAAAQLDEGPAETRLRLAVSAARKLFAEQPKLAVLNEHLSDNIAEIEQLLRFLDSPEFVPDSTVPAEWSARRESIMGRRHPDGRTIDVGPLLALRHVALVRETSGWSTITPELIDTPYVPPIHSARRSALILSAAQEADILLLVSRAESFEPEEWTRELFKKRPELARRTLVLFNQIDTVDAGALFGRDGFAAAFERTAQKLHALGIKGENLLISCARLPFLERALTEAGARAEDIQPRLEKLRAVLQRIEKQVATRPAGPLKTALMPACSEADAGIGTLRAKLTELCYREVLPDIAAQALSVLARAPIPDEAEKSALAERAQALKRRVGGTVKLFG